MSKSTDKLRLALLACEAIVSREARKAGITMAIRDPDANMPNRRTSHMLWMGKNALQLIEDGNIGKATRWLGFLQGALWKDNLITVKEIDDMNSFEDVGREARV